MKIGDSVDVIAGTYEGGKSIIMMLNDKKDHAILQASNLWIPVSHLRIRELPESRPFDPMSRIAPMPWE